MQQIDLIRIYQRKSALVIDDFPDMRGSIRRMLLGAGIGKVDIAGSGEEAVSRCEHHHYDIVLADYNLGEGKNGQQILEELRYRGLLKHTAIYMMITAETTKAMVFGALEYQPDDYLTKPFTQTVLQRRLNRMLLEKEALRDINRALDQKDYDAVIDLCDGHIDARDRFEQRCRRIKARCFYEQGRNREARALYQEVLADRPLEWAQIGFGRCLIADGELDAAERIFQQLVDANCLCLEVYDCLAEIRSQRGDVAGAQELLERASDISPNAILRQQMLAEISQDNGDWERAEKAHRRVLRLGANSCYEAPENYLRYARCISTQLRQGGGRDGRRLKEVEEVLERVRRRYRDDGDTRLRADLVAATAYADAGEREEARKRLDAAIGQLTSGDDAPPPSMEVTLELARAHQALGDSDEAKRLLIDLAHRHGDNEAIWERIDHVADEPLSDKGKARAIALNQQGKELFAQQDFRAAITLFGEALRLYPNNIALKLNLLLALVKSMGDDGMDETHLIHAERTVNSIRNLAPEHTLFGRYEVLAAHVAKLRAGKA